MLVTKIKVTQKMPRKNIKVEIKIYFLLCFLLLIRNSQKIIWTDVRRFRWTRVEHKSWMYKCHVILFEIHTFYCSRRFIRDFNDCKKIKQVSNVRDPLVRRKISKFDGKQNSIVKLKSSGLREVELIELSRKILRLNSRLSEVDAPWHKQWN